MSKLFSSTPPPPPGFTKALLIEHLNSLKTRLLEIVNFSKKKIVTSPTHIHWKTVDIEMAWSSSQNLFIEAYEVVCDISEKLNVRRGVMSVDLGFVNALVAFLEQIDRVLLHMNTSDDADQFSDTELKAIDNRILQVQHAINLIHTHVVVDFDYWESKTL